MREEKRMVSDHYFIVSGDGDGGHTISLETIRDLGNMEQ